MLRTTGDIGRDIGRSVASVHHLIESRRIDPTMVLGGGTRLFDDAAYEKIVAAAATMRKLGRPRTREAETAGETIVAK